MMTILFNGRLFSQSITGVQRYGIEVLKEIAKIPDLKVIVLIPKNADLNNLVEAPNIEYKKIGIFKTTGSINGILWEQISLKRYAKKHKLPLLSTGNLAPRGYKNNYVVLHDVIYLDDKLSPKKWAAMIKWVVKGYIYKAKAVFSVSEFSANQISAHYKVRKPIVTYTAPGHLVKIEEEKPNINIPDEFYFSLGAYAINKNFDYILALAKNNPDKYFVITGNNKLECKIENVIFTGYLKDSEIKYLYSHCNGFIQPSTYEGFGLPPLEALLCGCRNIYLSDIEVFKEIYDGLAVFFNPKDYTNTIDLNITKEIDEEKLKSLLYKCDWNHVASTIIDKIKEDNKALD